MSNQDKRLELPASASSFDSFSTTHESVIRVVSEAYANGMPKTVANETIRYLATMNETIDLAISLYPKKPDYKRQDPSDLKNTAQLFVAAYSDDTRFDKPGLPPRLPVPSASSSSSSSSSSSYSTERKQSTIQTTVSPDMGLIDKLEACQNALELYYKQLAKYIDTDATDHRLIKKIANAYPDNHHPGRTPVIKTLLELIEAKEKCINDNQLKLYE